MKSEELKHLHDSINEFIKLARSQEKKGIKKYGHPLDPVESINPETGKTYDWIEMIKEEFVDGFKYIEAERKYRNYVIAHIRLLLSQDEINKKAVFRWLDKISR